MFLGKKYILANELTKAKGMHIANISILKKAFADNEGMFISMNNCTFINSESTELPNNIKNAIAKFSGTFTDMSNKLPCTWVGREYGCTERELMRTGIVTEKVKISGKNFYVFNDEFVSKMQHKVGYILNREEAEKCMANKQILGYDKLGHNKFFTWY